MPKDVRRSRLSPLVSIPLAVAVEVGAWDLNPVRIAVWGPFEIEPEEGHHSTSAILVGHFGQSDATTTYVKYELLASICRNEWC